MEHMERNSRFAFSAFGLGRIRYGSMGQETGKGQEGRKGVMDWRFWEELLW